MTRGAEGEIPATTIAGIALAAALVPLNSTMLAVALPHIADDFDISKGRASVLITLYLVAMLVGQPFAGRLGDLVGARRTAIAAAAGFGLCSLLALIPGSFSVLVAIRGLQAAFASALVPSVQAMLRVVVPEAQRGHAFGVQGSVLGIGAGLGPLVGGVATAVLGWRSVFAVNVPVVAAVLYVLRWRVAATTNPTVHSATEVTARGRVWNSVFGAAFSTQALSTLAQYGLLLVVPIVLDSRGWSAAAVGVALSSLTVGMVVTGPFGGRLGDAHGRRLPVVIGLVMTLVAVSASAAGGDDVPSGLLVATLLLFGLGLGVATPSVMTAGIEAAPSGRIATAAGLLSAGRYVGSISSTVVLAVVVGDEGSGLAALLGVCAASLAVSVGAACKLPGGRRPLEPTEVVPVP
jgi:MFS family permease